MTSWAADASSLGVGVVAGLMGGPAVGINAVALRQLDVTREGAEDRAAVVFFGGELAVLAHSRFYGSFDPVVAMPVLQAGAWFGRNVGLGPVLQLDVLEPPRRRPPGPAGHPLPAHRRGGLPALRSQVTRRSPALGDLAPARRLAVAHPVRSTPSLTGTRSFHCDPAPLHGD